MIRGRIDVETPREVFQGVRNVLAKSARLQGQTIGVDATTLEANAALRRIVRRDTDQPEEEFLQDLAKASGMESPTREDLAHQAEHAVDLETGAVLAVTLQGADQGDTTTFQETLSETAKNLANVQQDPQASEHLQPRVRAEVVADKGYHSNETVRNLQQRQIRSYVSEPKYRGRRRWKDKSAEQQAVYANRRRIRGVRGKRLLRKRGELLERPFAHGDETGGMRRTPLHCTAKAQHLVFLASIFNEEGVSPQDKRNYRSRRDAGTQSSKRVSILLLSAPPRLCASWFWLWPKAALRRHARILKRLLIHVAGCNLGLLMRTLFGLGTPRGLQGLGFALLHALRRLVRGPWHGAGLVRYRPWAFRPPQYWSPWSVPRSSNL